jgi:apolipoprotein N-acyltransferase
VSNAESSPIPTSTNGWFGRLPMRLGFALVGGALAYLVFPNQGIWPLMFPMLLLIYRAGRGLRFGKALLVGLVAGFSFFAAQITWLSMYLGPEPLIGLALLEGIIFAVFYAVASAAVTALNKPLLGSLAFAAIWVAREWFSGNYPYGGFPWSRLVSSQTETPLARWVWLGGMPIADFLIVFASVLCFEYLRSTNRKRGLALSAAAIAFLYSAPLLLPISNAPEHGTLKIASAQGNANAGLFSNRESGRIYQNHIRATEQLLASKQSFDLLVWPENAVDLDLFGDPSNYRNLDSLVKRINRPLIFGTVTQRDKLYNTSVLWLPGNGMTDWYDKTRPVPFAEYVPDRAFWSAIAPDLIGLLNYDFSPGTRDGIFKVDGKKLGTLICFEIAVDDVPRNLVSGGAEVILSQTNNSDFGRSDEAYQQLAIAKLRAIETGRAIVNISTVGPSAVYLPDGSSLAKLGAFKRGFMNTAVPLRTSYTPAMFVVDPLNALSVITSLGFAVWLVSVRLRRK